MGKEGRRAVSTSGGKREGKEVFKGHPNLGAFDENYIPRSVLFRDRVMEKLRNYLKLIVDYGYKRDILIHGPPATGKTLCTSYLLKELQIGAPVTVAGERLHDAVFNLCAAAGLKVPKRGLSTEMLLQELLKSKPRFVVIDEIDRIRSEKEINFLIHKLSRSETSLVAISNSLTFMNRITDAAAKSSYRPVEIFFPPYSPEEIKEILLSRVREANAESMFDEASVALVTALTIKRNSDLRYALSLMKRLAEIALIESRNITEELVREVVADVDEEFLLGCIRKLKPLQLLILFLLSQSQTPQIQLHKLHQMVNHIDLAGVSRQWFSRAVNELDRMGVVNIISRGRGRGRGKDYLIAIAPEFDRDKVRQIAEPIVRKFYGFYMNS